MNNIDEGEGESVFWGEEHLSKATTALRFGSSCLKCYQVLKRKAVSFFTFAEKSVSAKEKVLAVEVQSKIYPDRVCSEEECRLNSDIGLTGRSVLLYEKYKAKYCEMHPSVRNEVHLKSLRTLMRAIAANKNLLCISSNDRGKGSILTAAPSMKNFVQNGLDQDDKKDVPCFSVVYSGLRELASKYKDEAQQKRFRDGTWSMVSEIKQVSLFLWRYQWIMLESRREKLYQLVAEREAEGDIVELGWPFSNGSCATEVEFYDLPKYTYRKVVRVFGLIQEQGFVLDRMAVRPIIWGVSICAILNGGKQLMSILNKLGYCLSYSVINRERLRMAKGEE